MPLNELGHEVPDNTPVALPSRLRLPQSRVDQIRAYIQMEMSRSAEQKGFETFREADDFSMPDVEWSSPYEEIFEPPSPPAGQVDSPRGDPPNGGTKSDPPPEAAPPASETA